jgi:thiamine transport system permease protein
MLLVQHRLERHDATPVALSRRVAQRPSSIGERAWVGGNVLFLVVWLALPLGALVRQSLRVGDHWSLGGWRGLSVTDGTGMLVPPLEAVGNSLRFAAVATLLAVSLGTLAAIGLARSHHPIVRRIEALLLLPLGTSAVTVGFGFLIALDAPIDLRASPWLVPIAQAIVALPFAVRTMSPVVRSIDPRLHDAAAVLGAGPVRTWWWVDLPLLRRALLVAGGFAFAISLGEFGATTVIARADAPTVPVVIGRLLGRAGPLNRTEAFALSVILMVLTTVVALVVDQLRGDERRRGWW